MFTTLRLGALSIWLFAFTTRCCAEDLTFVLGGVVSEVPASLASEFAIGDPISGSYTFDTEAADSLPADSSQGSYPFSVSSFSMTIGSYEVSSVGDGDIAIEDNFGGKDGYTVVSFASGDPVGGSQPSLMALQLADSTQTVFSTDVLPLVPPAPVLFDSPDITIDFLNGGLGRLVGSLRTLQVPEPSTVGLMLLGSILLLRRNDR